MKKNNRCRKLGRSGKGSACEGDFTPVDRLSDLPSFVLHHILSSLDTKTLVQTSVLSRQWRSVWKQVPALYLDDASFGYGNRKFCRFVDKVLSLRCPTNVDKISYNVISAEGSYNVDLVVRVIEYAVSHGTRHLVLHLGHDIAECYEIPKWFRSISSCSLETLSLHCFCVDDRFGSFGFSLLTTLELVDCVFFLPDPELFDPFSKFLRLKKLTLDTTTYMSAQIEGLTFRIAGLQLQELKLSYVDMGNMEIYAPKLKSLVLLDFGTSLELSKLVLPSLDHADIEINWCNLSTQLPIEDLVIMLEGLHNVKSLTLRDGVIKLLSEDCEFLVQRPSLFTRLEILNLGMNPIDIPYKLVSYFFKGSACAAPRIKVI